MTNKKLIGIGIILIVLLQVVGMSSNNIFSVGGFTPPDAGGDVVGPSSATDNAITRFDGTGGVTLQNSGILIDDSDNLTGVTALTVDGTSATSTFAGGLTIETSGFVYDFSTNNVGVGTTSPFAKLSVVGQIVAEFFTATSTTATSTFNGGLKLNLAGTGIEFQDGTIQTSAAGGGGVTGYERVTNTSSACSTTAGVTCSTTVSCTGSKEILGGGGSISISVSHISVVHNFPSDTDTWSFNTRNQANTSAHTVTAYAICGDSDL